jgi:serine phosphatase RsbU (regulator of sigma subunit)
MTSTAAPARETSAIVAPVRVLEVRSTPPQARGRWWQLPAAVLLAFATITYTAVWMYCVRTPPLVYPDFDFSRQESAGTLTVTRVPEGAARDAGLRVGDVITAVNAKRLRTMNPFFHAVTRAKPGDMVAFDVKRSGTTPFHVQYRLRVNDHPKPDYTLPQRIAFEALGSYQLPFVIVAIAVLLSQRTNRHAWIMAFVFCGFISSAPLLIFEGQISPALRGFCVAYVTIFSGCTSAFFYYFFTTFPVRSPMDQRVPWLKTATLGAALAVSVPLAIWALLAGGAHPLLLGAELFLPNRLVSSVVYAYWYGMYLLGLVAMVWTMLRAPTAEARRKTAVMVYGTLAATVPFLILTAVGILTNTAYYRFPFWVWVPTAVSGCLMPLAIAYAVVKHRVLEIPVLLKRSARYFLVQRGFVLLHVMFSVAITLVIASLVSGYVRNGPHWSLPVVLTGGVTFGSVLALSGIRFQRSVKQRIDRAFFRSAYDARHILEDLAAKTRTAPGRDELAALLEGHLRQALHPVSLAVYFERQDHRLELMRGNAAAEVSALSADNPVLQQAAERAQAWELPPELIEQNEVVRALGAECLVPILGSQPGHLQGLLVLGARLSEEPYSSEDRRLLTSVASQAGVVLRSICLAERMAERMEADRRAAHEIELAREVQRKLLPQKQPPLATLDYAGLCLQARVVGGDYYDFLELAPGQVGVVLADIAGKGFAAALLMANLQANLRSQFPLALQDLPALLRSVNRLFYENTEPSHYATFLFARYEDAQRKLTYANCGHNPPLVVRVNGNVEQLRSTATVLGLFPDWECSVAEVQLAAGDALVMYTDGVTEAEDGSGEEFGISRLANEIRRHADAPASALLDHIVSAVRRFSEGEQADDITLVVARCR